MFLTTANVGKRGGERLQRPVMKRGMMRIDDRRGGARTRGTLLELCAALTHASAVADIYQIYHLNGDSRSITTEKSFTVYLATLLLDEYFVNIQVCQKGSFKAHAELFV